MDATDQALLREFATRRCERSFRRLVERHLRLVYSVAERVTGERGLAEEVAQTTFARLAEKSAELNADTVIAGWLYHTARNLALMTVRSEVRRRQREEIAATMNTDEPGPNVVAEHLESAMDQLPPADRDALVLRFFEDRNLREVGHELGLSEDAARMRVNRALEKLRGVFGKLGITGSAAWLGTTLTASATASVPAGLGATITTAILGGTAVAAATTALITETTTTTMNLFNLKTAAAILGAAAVTGTTTYVVQERQADQLRADYQTLNETHGRLAAEQQEGRELIQLRDEQIERLKRDVADLPRLRGEVDRLNRMVEELAQLNSRTQQLAAREKAELDEANSRSYQAWKLGERKRLSQLSYAGRNTPEAALESVLWASRESHWKELLDSIDLSAEVVAEQTANGTIERYVHSAAGALYSLVRTTSVSATGSPDSELALRGARGGAEVHTFSGGVFPGQTPLTEPPDTYAGASELHLVPVNTDGREAESGINFYLKEFEDGWKVLIPGTNLPR